jgi:hypothetical protein
MEHRRRFVLTDHAAVVSRERRIPPEWVQKVLENPRLRIPDAGDPDLFHALAPIPEREDRILNVVYNCSTNPWRVVTAYFDRAWRGML